jgi:hypothetical protein
VAGLPLPTKTDQSGQFITQAEFGQPGRYRLRMLDPDSGVTSKPIVVVIKADPGAVDADGPGRFPSAFGVATLNRLRRLNVFTPRNLPCRRTPRAGQPMTATDGLNRALLSFAAAGDRPRCSDPITRELWTAEHAAHRAIAVKWCKRCPVLILCRQAAEERDERFGVWGGVDRTIRPRRKWRD